MGILDYKKAFKEFYEPKTLPSLIDVPEMKFLQVDGKGSPNDEDGEYSKALELLYALSYAIKMSPKSGEAPKDYFKYVVPPLEGLWWFVDGPEHDMGDKNKFCWTSMIRQPEFVTDEVFSLAVRTVQKKKGIETDKARLVSFTEGLCVHCMHIGSYDDEPETLAKMREYAAENGFEFDLTDTRRHHEIYLSDPRKSDVAKRKTILRYPVKKI